jgi:hypothetical protein
LKIVKMTTDWLEPIVERGYRDSGEFQWIRETAINALESGATRIKFGIEW